MFSNHLMSLQKYLLQQMQKSGSYCTPPLLPSPSQSHMLSYCDTYLVLHFVIQTAAELVHQNFHDLVGFP